MTASTARRLRHDGPLVEVTGLTKRYGRLPALTRVDLAVGSGEVVALVGPHGSGKSTLLRILVDLLRPSSGTARVLGQTSRRGARRRRLVGYVPSPVRHDAVGTVGGALSYAAALSDARTSAFRTLARSFGLRMLAPVARLDAEEAQLLALAQALGHAPLVALLDEPTTGLSAESVALLRQQIDLLREAGSAVLLAAHRLETVEGMADRVVLLCEGEITLDGRTDAIALPDWYGDDDVEPRSVIAGVS